MREQLAAWDAVETAARIANGEVSAMEVVDAAIRRARSWQPRINAIAHEDYDSAKATSAQPPAGPLSGVPTFVKDLEDVAGSPTGFGTTAVPHVAAKSTAPSVAQFLSTGLISLGKSTTAEFGFTGTTEPVFGAATRNPVDLAHSSGGSSGGAAALVAAGVVPIAHGGDGGGSLRIPAAFCGLVALKASRGRLAPMRSSKRMLVKIATYGVITRTVRDTAAFYAAIEADHRPRPRQLPPIGHVRGPGSESYRIGFYLDGPFGYGVDPDVERAVHETARRLEGMGHDVFEVQAPYTEALADDFLAHWAFLAWGVESALRWNKRCDVSKLEPWTLSLSKHFRRQWWKRLPAAIYRLHRYPRRYESNFRRYDVLLSPVSASPAPRIGELSPALPYEDKLERMRRLLPYTPVQNASGGPAISLPATTTTSGLPVAIQLAAPTGHERRLLELSYALES